MVTRMLVLLLATALVPLAPVEATGADDSEVRRELELQYQRLAEAHDRQDLKSIASLKTQDFHAIHPDGRIGDVREMEEYTKRFLETNKPPYNVRNTIRELAVSKNRLIAVVEIFQEASRMRELAGKLRKVDTNVMQRETWSKTADGWKLKSVDNVRNQKRYVDGKRVDPAKPFDPDAPPYEPNEVAD
jgi:hypothetical protein